MTHTHKVAPMGQRNDFVVGCPACQEILDLLARNRERWEAAQRAYEAEHAAMWEGRHIYGQGQKPCQCYRCTGKNPRR